jgi:hypothetical protein
MVSHSIGDGEGLENLYTMKPQIFFMLPGPHVDATFVKSSWRPMG